MTAYIDADDVLAAMPLSTRPTSPADVGSEDEAKIARITSLCGSTAEMIDAEATYDFHRHPAADPYADEVWIVDGRGSRTLHAHYGIVDLTSIEVRWSLGSDWTALDEITDYELVSMFEAESPDRPYDHVQFVSRLPVIARGVRLTGIRGWQAPPSRLVEMNVAWVRQHLAGGDAFTGAMQIPEGFVPVARLQLPDDVRMFLTREKSRFQECYT